MKLADRIRRLKKLNQMYHVEFSPANMANFLNLEENQIEHDITREAKKVKKYQNLMLNNVINSNQ